MKQALIAIVSLIIGIGVGYVIFDGNVGKAKDAITHATVKKTKEVTLPSKGDTYEVLGVADGLQNFAVKYDDNFFRGGQILSIEANKALKKWGIKTIISICPTDLERLVCEKYDIKLLEVPFEKIELNDEDLGKFVKSYEESEKPVYVHCHGGTHRGGLFGYVYRRKVLGWDDEKAKKEYDALGGDPDNKDGQMVEIANKFSEKK